METTLIFHQQSEAVNAFTDLLGDKSMSRLQSPAEADEVDSPPLPALSPLWIPVTELSPMYFLWAK